MEINERTSCVLVRNEFAAIIFRLECTFYETTEATIRHAVAGKSFEYLLCGYSSYAQKRIWNINLVPYSFLLVVQTFVV